MGTLLNKPNSRKEIINGNIKNFLERSNIMYAPLYEGAPTFVTYFSIDNINTTVDQNLEGVIENLGEESPIKFKKINDLAIYGFDSSSLNTELTELGAENTYESEAVILPNTVVPKPGDFFCISYDNSKFLFQIKEITIDKLNSYKFYKVSFRLRNSKLEIIEKQISGEYDTIYESLGTNNKVVLEKSNSIILKNIKVVLKELQLKYIDLFYKEKFELLCTPITSVNKDQISEYLYSSYLVKFINNSSLLKIEHPFFQSVFITDCMNMDRNFSFITSYEKSLYHAIEEMSFNKLRNLSYAPVIIDNKSFPAYESYEKFYDTIGIDSINEVLVDSIISLIEPSPGLSHFIESNTLFEDDYYYFYENVIIKFLNKQLIFDNHLVNKIQKYGVELASETYERNSIRALKGFFYAPIMMYILGLFKKNINEATIENGHFWYNRDKLISDSVLINENAISEYNETSTLVDLGDLQIIPGSEELIMNDSTLYSCKNDYFVKNESNIVINRPIQFILGKNLILKYYKNV